ELQCNISFSIRFWINSRLSAITGNFVAFYPSGSVLSAHHASIHTITRHRRNGAENLGLFGSHLSCGDSRGGLHGRNGQQLQHMVLHHVTQGAGFFIVRSAVFYPDRFGGSDLHVIHIATVPDRLEDAVSKSEHK